MKSSLNQLIFLANSSRELAMSVSLGLGLMDRWELSTPVREVRMDESWESLMNYSVVGIL
jgi:hypothetical protein